MISSRVCTFTRSDMKAFLPLENHRSKLGSGCWGKLMGSPDTVPLPTSPTSSKSKYIICRPAENECFCSHLEASRKVPDCTSPIPSSHIPRNDVNGQLVEMTA